MSFQSFFKMLEVLFFSNIFDDVLNFIDFFYFMIYLLAVNFGDFWDTAAFDVESKQDT